MFNPVKWYKERRLNGMRPWWQIILLLPIGIVYWPAKAFTDWVETYL